VTERAHDPAAPVCIITGATTGIGAATAVELAGAVGARLVLASLPGSDFDPVTASVLAAGGAAEPVEADVRSAGDCERIAEVALERYGRIDLVHANAGFVDQSTIVDGEPERWQRVVDTNLLGAAFTVRAALPPMIAQRSGHVVFTASLSGRDTYVGEPLYIASKWGLVGFGHALRQEVLPLGIRVTLIEPGLVDTPFTRNSPVIAPLFDRSEPLHAEDVARAVVYAYLQPRHVNVNEIAVAPVRERGFEPGELETALAALAAHRRAERDARSRGEEP
jgi:NADP-dependent 3-hydroxy acid dehydrogenase YdfG